MQRILFVCLGNICRSPAAQAVARVKAQKLGLKLHLDSAGTSDWHIGEPPYDEMQAVALSNDYDMSDLRARQIREADFFEFDLLLGMDRRNVEALNDLRPKGATARIGLITDYASDRMADHVPDPYYTRDFSGALRLIEDCVDGVLKAQNATAGHAW